MTDLFFLIVLTSIASCYFFEITKILILSIIDVLQNREADYMTTVDLNLLKSEYGIEQKKANDGVWQKLVLLPNVKVCVRRHGNTEYQRYLRKHLYKPYQRQFRENTIDPEKVDAVMTKAMCRHILVDWEGFRDSNGNEVPYSYEEAHAILSKPELEPLKNEILEIAQNDEFYRFEELREAEKNLDSI
jgi:hypothetical protein